MKIMMKIKDGNIVKNASDIYEYLKEFKEQDREYFIVLGLDTKNRILYREIAHIGTLNGSLISSREIFKKAIINSANSIIISHNHPSGDQTPSDEDIRITDTLKKAGDILGIKVLDHVIISSKGFVSIEDDSCLP